jgi:K+ transporter
LRVARYSLIAKTKRKPRIAGLMVKRLKRGYHMVKTTTKIEHYEKRFGIVAIEKGFISSEELIEALKVQVGEEIEIGKHRLLGEILLYQDRITARQIDEVVKTLFKQIKVAKKKSCSKIAQDRGNPRLTRTNLIIIDDKESIRRFSKKGSS